jgi:hypothetical protein
MKRLILISLIMVLVVASVSIARDCRWNGNVVAITMGAKKPATNQEPSLRTGTDEIIFEDGFEGAFTWTPHDLTAVTGAWHINDFQAYGGSGMSWWCADAELGGYRDDWYMVLDTPLINLTATLNPEMTFYSNYWVEEPAGATPPWDGWDGMNLRISTDNGATWTILTNAQINPDYTCNSLYSFGFQHGEGENIPGWAGEAIGWHQVTADLSDYVDETVKIRFALASDPNTSTQTNPDYFAWQVDEIEIHDGATQIFYNNGEDSTGFETLSLVEVGGDLWHVEDNWYSAPSPTHILRCGIEGGSYNPNMNDAIESGFIDLTSYVAGTVEGDFMVMGNILDPNPFPDCDFWSVEVSPDSGMSWFNVTNPWGEPGGNNYVYLDAPADWASFVSAYPSIANLNFTPYLGYVCQFRIILESDGDQPTGSGLHIDDVWVDYSSAYEYDCGCTYLHIPFPTSVNFQTHGEAEFSNLGSNLATGVPGRWQVQGSPVIWLTPNLTLQVGESITRDFTWTPTTVGTYWHKAWSDWEMDENRLNDTCTVESVEVTPEDEWVLGYDNRTTQWGFNYETGEGASCRFTPGDDGIPGAFSVMEAQFLFDAGQALTEEIDLHIYEGDASEQPGEEIAVMTLTVVPPMEVFPNWKIVDVSAISELQGRTANFWFWLEVTNTGTGDRYPQILGDNQVWGDQHFYVYDGIAATPSAHDYMIRAMVTPSTGIDDDQVELAPGTFHLAQNYPNPFNPITTLRFNLPYVTPVTLKVYNVMGQEVATLVDQKLASGSHQLEFNANDLPSGIYFYRIEAAGFTDMKKMVLLK